MNLKTTGLDENDVDTSYDHRNNLPQELKNKRDEAEKMKEEIAHQWTELSDKEKIKWWNNFSRLLVGEIKMEGTFFKMPLKDMEDYYCTAWNNSKEYQKGERAGLGKCHTKASAIIFALDYCFQAYNKGDALYFFKFTGKFFTITQFQYSHFLKHALIHILSFTKQNHQQQMINLSIQAMIPISTPRIFVLLIKSI